MTKPSSNPELIQDMLREPGASEGRWKNKTLRWTKKERSWSTYVEEIGEKATLHNNATNEIHYYPDSKMFTVWVNRSYYKSRAFGLDAYDCKIEMRGGEVGFVFSCSGIQTKCELPNEELFETEHISKSALSRYSLIPPFMTGVISCWDSLALEELESRGVLGERAINPFRLETTDAWLPEATPKSLNAIFSTLSISTRVGWCDKWIAAGICFPYLFQLDIETPEGSREVVYFDSETNTLKLRTQKRTWVPPQIRVSSPEKNSQVSEDGAISENWYFHLYVGELNIGRVRVQLEEIHEDFELRCLEQHPENCLDRVWARVDNIWRTQIYDHLVEGGVLAPKPETAALETAAPAPDTASQYVVIPSESIPQDFPTAKTDSRGFYVRLTQSQSVHMMNYGYTEREKCEAPDEYQIRFDSLLDYSIFLEAFLETYTLESAAPMTSSERFVDLRPYGVTCRPVPQLPMGIPAWTIPRRDFDRLKSLYTGEVTPTMYHVEPTQVNYKKCTVPPSSAEKILLVPEGGGLDRPIPAVPREVPHMDQSLLFVTLGHPKSE